MAFTSSRIGGPLRKFSNSQSNISSSDGILVKFIMSFCTCAMKLITSGKVCPFSVQRVSVVAEWNEPVLNRSP
eukprot:4546098-Karenia_brevis.AAC.1